MDITVIKKEKEDLFDSIEELKAKKLYPLIIQNLGSLSENICKLLVKSDANSVSEEKLILGQKDRIQTLNNNGIISNEQACLLHSIRILRNSKGLAHKVSVKEENNWRHEDICELDNLCTKFDVFFQEKSKYLLKSEIAKGNEIILPNTLRKYNRLRQFLLSNNLGDSSLKDVIFSIDAERSKVIKEIAKELMDLQKTYAKETYSMTLSSSYFDLFFPSQTNCYFSVSLALAISNFEFTNYFNDINEWIKTSYPILEKMGSCEINNEMINSLYKCIEFLKTFFICFKTKLIRRFENVTNTKILEKANRILMKRLSESNMPIPVMSEEYRNSVKWSVDYIPDILLEVKLIDYFIFDCINLGLNIAEERYLNSIKNASYKTNETIKPEESKSTVAGKNNKFQNNNYTQQKNYEKSVDVDSKIKRITLSAIVIVLITVTVLFNLDNIKKFANSYNKKTPVVNINSTSSSNNNDKVSEKVTETPSFNVKLESQGYAFDTTNAKQSTMYLLGERYIGTKLDVGEVGYYDIRFRVVNDGEVDYQYAKSHFKLTNVYTGDEAKDYADAIMYELKEEPIDYDKYVVLVPEITVLDEEVGNFDSPDINPKKPLVDDYMFSIDNKNWKTVDSKYYWKTYQYTKQDKHCFKQPYIVYTVLVMEKEYTNYRYKFMMDLFSTGDNLNSSYGYYFNVNDYLDIR